MGKEIVRKENSQDYKQLVDDIGNLLSEGRKKVAHMVNSTMVETYWLIGRYIVEYEQQGNERAVYGTDLINKLSKDLTNLYRKGFGRSNLLYIRKLYLSFPKSGTLSHLLTWSHYYEVLKCDDPLEMGFLYQTMRNGTLERQRVKATDEEPAFSSSCTKYGQRGRNRAIT